MLNYYRNETMIVRLETKVMSQRGVQPSAMQNFHTRIQMMKKTKKNFSVSYPQASPSSSIVSLLADFIPFKISMKS